MESSQSYGRPRKGWEDNIKRDLVEIGCKDGTWMELAQDHVIVTLDVRGVTSFVARGMVAWLVNQVHFYYF